MTEAENEELVQLVDRLVRDGQSTEAAERVTELVHTMSEDEWGAFVSGLSEPAVDLLLEMWNIMTSDSNEELADTARESGEATGRTWASVIAEIPDDDRTARMRRTLRIVQQVEEALSERGATMDDMSDAQVTELLETVGLSPEDFAEAVDQIAADDTAALVAAGPRPGPTLRDLLPSVLGVEMQAQSERHDLINGAVMHVSTDGGVAIVEVANVAHLHNGSIYPIAAGDAVSIGDTFVGHVVSMDGATGAARIAMDMSTYAEMRTPSGVLEEQVTTEEARRINEAFANDFMDRVRSPSMAERVLSPTQQEPEEEPLPPPTRRVIILED